MRLCLAGQLLPPLSCYCADHSQPSSVKLCLPLNAFVLYSMTLLQPSSVLQVPKHVCMLVWSQISVQLQPNTTCTVYIAKEFYIACLNDTFRPFHRPSSGCPYLLSHYIQRYVLAVNQLSCTSVIFPSKVITIVIELKVINI